MLRVHFTAEDFGRVRLAAGPDPLWEARLSAQLMHDAGAARTFGRWRSDVTRRIPAEARPYLHLIQPGLPTDFLTPDAGCTDFDAGVEEVVRTAPERIAAELADLGGKHAIAAWVRALSAGEPRALHVLRVSMTAHYQHAVVPVWGRVRSCVEKDRADRVQGIGLRGVVEALSQLHPTVSWSGRVLRVDDGEPLRDLNLGGRGLRLVPSYFCWRGPVTFADPGLTPTLVFPVARGQQVSDSPLDQDGALGALLGRTRAAALLALVTPVTTMGLARLMEASSASASQHTTVLRRAGLIASRREGRYMVHSLTPLGAGLLNAAGADEREMSGRSA